MNSIEPTFRLKLIQDFQFLHFGIQHAHINNQKKKNIQIIIFEYQEVILLSS